jgi:Domain of unknown function (DUF1330)
MPIHSNDLPDTAAGGKVVGLEGPPPPKRVGLTEWDSLEKAEAFYKSKAWTDLTPERDKGGQDYSSIRSRSNELSDLRNNWKPRLTPGLPFGCRFGPRGPRCS